MKIIALWNNYDIAAEEAALPATCWLTDSCLLREGRPFYIPDFDDDFRLFPSVALRIDRLGKGIASRFASRYWNEVSVWLSARACTLASQLAAKGLPVDRAVAYDNSLVASPFFALDAGQLAGLSFHVRVNGLSTFQWSAGAMHRQPEHVIEAISGNTTLKTGDIILPGLPAQGIAIAPGDDIEIIIDGPGTSTCPDGTVINHFKIK